MSQLDIFPDSKKLSIAAAAFIIRQAQYAIAGSGRFILALSGGQTPEQLFRILRTPPFTTQMPWQQTFVFWGDERCVPLEDQFNNAHAALDILLNHVEIPEENIFRIPADQAPVAAAWQYEKTLQEVLGPDLPQFDLILLGLGGDGHTASLFPGTAVLHEKIRWVKEVTADVQPVHRITLTLPVINNARNILFLVSGKGKSSILKRVLSPAPGQENFPAQLVQPLHGLVHWYTDADAASEL